MRGETGFSRPEREYWSNRQREQRAMTTTDDVRPSGDAAARVLKELGNSGSRMYSIDANLAEGYGLLPEIAGQAYSETQFHAMFEDVGFLFDHLHVLVAEVQELRAREAALVEALRENQQANRGETESRFLIQWAMYEDGYPTEPYLNRAHFSVIDAFRALFAAHDARLARGEDAG